MIEFYYNDGCPYCIKVKVFLEREKIPYVPKVVPLGRTMNATKEELVKLGGKTQVPFIHDPDKGIKMYESDDIIEYLAKQK